MRTMRKRWARYALPAGFAKREYPKDSSCHMIKKNMMDHKNQLYGCQTTTRSTNTRGNKSNGNAKFKVTPHRHSTVLVKHLTQRFHRKLGELESQFARNFCSIHKRPVSLEEVKSCVQRRDETLRSAGVSLKILQRTSSTKEQ
jgi:hypothetical protein